MIDVEATADLAIARLRQATDRARQAATLGYFPSAQENLGVYAKDIRSVVRELRHLVRDEPPKTVLALARAIIARDTLEGRQVAYEVVMHHPGAMAALNRRELERLGRGMDNWASVDGFACSLSGAAWREGRIEDVDVARWASSRNPWWRRAALVSTVPLNLKSRGGRGDPARTLAFCERLARDAHPMVQKALSWALRAAIAHDRRGVRAFLDRHGDALPALVRREVDRKLRTGRKNG